MHNTENNKTQLNNPDYLLASFGYFLHESANYERADLYLCAFLQCFLRGRFFHFFVIRAGKQYAAHENSPFNMNLYSLLTLHATHASLSGAKVL
jgi:hypothetical protein